MGEENNMKKLSVMLLICLWTCALALTGCGKETDTESGVVSEIPETETTPESENALETETANNSFSENSDAANIEEVSEEADEYYLVIDETFTLPEKDVIVTGRSQNRTLYSGAEVDIISGTSKKQTVIGDMEAPDSRELVDELPAGSYSAVELVGLTRADVQIGDILLLRDTGKTSDRLTAEFIVDYDDSLACLLDMTGQTLKFSFLPEYYDVFYSATIDSIELIEDIPDPYLISETTDQFVITLTLDVEMTYIDNMEAYFYFETEETYLEFEGIIYSAPVEDAE